jgi:hypothetical protein
MILYVLVTSVIDLFCVSQLSPVHNIKPYVLFVGLFSWSYNPLWLHFHSPVAGFIFLAFEVS